MLLYPAIHTSIITLFESKNTSMACRSIQMQNATFWLEVSQQDNKIWMLTNYSSN